MGGLLRRMPWTGLFVLIGVLAIAGLPPLNGFVSEWLLFQAALQAWQLDSGVLRTLVPLAAAALALTAALVAVTFVKVFGIAFLGQARSRRVRRARPAPLGMRAALGGLAVLCIGLGVLPAAVLDLLGQVPVRLLGVGLPQISAHGWLWLTPVSAQTASYSAPLVVMLLLGIAGLTLLLFKRLLHSAGGRRRRRRRRCDPWDCGFAVPTPAMQASAGGFVQPLRRVFAPVFALTETMARHDDGRRRWQVRITDRAWAWLYRPVSRLVEQAARRVVRLQSGSVRLYLGWTLATLMVLLWIIT